MTKTLRLIDVPLYDVLVQINQDGTDKAKMETLIQSTISAESKRIEDLLIVKPLSFLTEEQQKDYCRFIRLHSASVIRSHQVKMITEMNIEKYVLESFESLKKRGINDNYRFIVLLHYLKCTGNVDEYKRIKNQFLQLTQTNLIRVLNEGKTFNKEAIQSIATYYEIFTHDLKVIVCP